MNRPRFRALAMAALVAAFLLAGCTLPLTHHAAEVRWIPFRVNAIVTARAWIPAHNEPVHGRDGQVGIEAVPEMFRMAFAGSWGGLSISVPADAYAGYYEGERVILVGRVSDEPHPKVSVEWITTPHNNGRQLNPRVRVGDRP